MGKLRRWSLVNRSCIFSPSANENLTLQLRVLPAIFGTTDFNYCTFEMFERLVVEQCSPLPPQRRKQQSPAFCDDFNQQPQLRAQTRNSRGTKRPLGHQAQLFDPERDSPVIKPEIGSPTTMTRIYDPRTHIFHSKKLFEPKRGWLATFGNPHQIFEN